jgi:guanine nucleotide-binding protein subunit alpha
MAIQKIMCFGGSNKEDPDLKKSREIEKQLREDQKRMAKEVKLLLLGMPYTSLPSQLHWVK